jgi:hypothetical protein
MEGGCFYAGTVPSLPMEEQFEQYKYFIIVDGNTAASTRSTLILASDAVPLWQETEYAEYFFCNLRPFVHYVPVARNLENLYSVIEWVRQHPVESMEIAKEGQEFAKQHFNTAAVSSYLFELLLQYSKLMRFQPLIDNSYESVFISDNHVFSGFVEQSGGCEHWENKPASLSGRVNLL